MTYERMLEKRCKTIDELTNFIDETSKLFYEIEENEGLTTVKVYCIDDDESWEFIEYFEFYTDSGKLIK